MAKLDERFSKGQPMMARKKLDRVELPEKGKIRTQEFKDFEIQFSDALKNIHDMGPEEARRILLCKIPDWMRVFILEEEAKKKCRESNFGFGGFQGWKIRKHPKQFRVLFQNPPHSHPSRTHSWAVFGPIQKHGCRPKVDWATGACVRQEEMHSDCKTAGTEPFHPQIFCVTSR
jgi:hypothetical protein